VAKSGSRAAASDWELIVEARARRARGDLAALADQFEFRHECDTAKAALAVVDTILQKAAPFWLRPRTWWLGSRVERAWRALHEAETCVFAADPELAARLPALRQRVAVSLPEHDQRLKALNALKPTTGLTRAERATVIDAVRAAFDASDDEHTAARAFRNKLVVTALVLLGLNTLIGVVGLVWPDFLPMCVARPDAPGRSVCVAGGGTSGRDDVWLTQLMGAAGAVVAAVVLVVRRPSLSPYILVGYQALIKVLLGALLAVIGVLALRAGVGDGLIGLRVQAALLIAAVVFGYAQQIGTRLLDNYADRLLDQVRPLPRSGDSEARQV
jgi:hypothetical protein